MKVPDYWLQHEFHFRQLFQGGSEIKSPLIRLAIIYLLLLLLLFCFHFNSGAWCFLLAQARIANAWYSLLGRAIR